MTTTFVEFDGAGDYISVPQPTPDVFDVGSRLTVACWVKGAAQYYRFFGGQWDYGVDERCWCLGAADGPSDKPLVYLSDNGEAGASHLKKYKSSLTAFDGTWHHVAFTFDEGVLTLFVDGVEDTNPTKVEDGAFTSLHDAAAPLTIGAILQNSSPALPFTGDVADVRVYNRALAAAEVAAIYATPPGTVELTEIRDHNGLNQITRRIAGRRGRRPNFRTTSTATSWRTEFVNTNGTFSIGWSRSSAPATAR
jgi:hypothetical protein